MATISNVGIAAGSTISATHITNIIEALDGTSVTGTTVKATGSFSGSFIGNLTGTASSATKASTLVSAQNIIMTFYTNGAVGSPSYVYGTTGDGSYNNAYATSALIVSASLIATTASYALVAALASNAVAAVQAQSAFTAATATTATQSIAATNASYVPFSGITSLPPALFVNGVSSVATAITGSTDDSKISNGAFYPIDATTGSLNITLNTRGGGTDTTIGFEFTAFYKAGNFDVAFIAGTSQTIISPNNYLKLNGTGSAAVVKYIAADTWALIGNLKA